MIRRVRELPINMVEDEKLYLQPGGNRAPQDDAHGGLRTKHFPTSCKLPAEMGDGARRDGASPGQLPQSQTGRSNANRSSPDVDVECAPALPTGNRCERTQCGTFVSRNQQLFAPGCDQIRRLSSTPSSPLTGESGLFLPQSAQVERPPRRRYRLPAGANGVGRRPTGE